MEGMDLKFFADELRKVSVRYDQNPAATIKDVEVKLGTRGLAIASYYGCAGAPFNFLKNYRHLPLEALRGFNFDELCKLRYSSEIMMDQSIEDLFNNDPRFRIVHKIQNSMWRWGMNRGLWNEIVDVYNGIRNFTLSPNPEFELRLDWTTWLHPYGYSTYARKYIDGVFAYFVYYKGQHVMTIGFSVMAKRRILIQQVQSTERRGNRYLYKLPSNRLELVIERFMQSFPSHRLYVVEAESLIKKTIADYKEALSCVKDNLDNPRKYTTQEDLHSFARNKTQYEERIQHLETDKDRLASFYGNTGRFGLGTIDCNYNKLSHRPILFPQA